MLPCKSRVIRQILQSKVLCSTAITSQKEQKSVSLIQKLSVEFEDLSPIINDLRDSELNSIHFDEWKSRIYALKKYHFNDTECFKMISSYPWLLKIPLENFNDSLGQWFASNMSMDKVHLILFHNPYLCEVDVADLRKRLPQLRTYSKTSDMLAELIINSPNVMYDNWEFIIKKIDYLTKLRRFKMGDVIQSSALSKSLDFIKFRIDLLEKCGIYKQDNTPIHKLNKYDKSRFVNPDLKSILELNLSCFIELANITPEEYSVSKELFNEQEFDDEENLIEEYRRKK